MTSPMSTRAAAPLPAPAAARTVRIAPTWRTVVAFLIFPALIAGCTTAAAPGSSPGPALGSGASVTAPVTLDATASVTLPHIATTTSGGATHPTATRATAPAPAAAPFTDVDADWDAPDPSVHADPAVVLAPAPAHGPVRVVTVRAVAGRPHVEVREASSRAAATPLVREAQHASGALSVTVDSRSHIQAAQSNDAYRWVQWGLDRLSAESIWTSHTGAGTTVAVIDTGVLANHPDLKGVVVPGIDYVTSGGNGTADGHGHGTHVAGIIGAVANNGIGVAGLATGVKILPVRALDNSGSGWDSDIAKGIIYAADHGAAVINLSLGGEATDAAAAATAYATSRGVVVVAAAGNERAEGNPVTYPAAYPNVIGVAATDSTDTTASFSNTGSYVDLAAPGVDIASTYLSGSYVYMSGTSMASPYVAAAAALLKSANASLTGPQIQTLLEQSATDLGTRGRDNLTGFGLVNPKAALCAATPSCAAPTPTPTPTLTPTQAPTTSPTSNAPTPTAAPTSSTAPTPSTNTPTAGPTPTASPTTPDATSRPSEPAPTTTPPPSTTPAPSPSTTPTPARAATTTRILSKPALMSYGATITGTAQVSDARTGIGLRSTPIQMCTKIAPARAYTCTRASTDAYGKFTYRVRALANTTLFVTHPGTVTTTPSVSSALIYPVTPKVSLTAGRGQLTARLTPAARQRVTLDRWNGRTWSTVSSGTISASGAVTFTHLSTAYYRIRVPASASLASTATGYVLVRR